MIPFHSNRLMDYNKQKLFSGGYLFLQSIYYGLKLDSVCRKIKSRHKFEYDLNTILSDLIYTRVLEPSRKRSSFRATKQFLEPPTYQKKSKRRSNITIFRVCRKKCYTPCIYKDCGTFLTNQLSKMRV